MAVIKVGNNSIGKISVIEPYDDPIGTPEYKLEGPWVRPSGWLDMPTFASGEDKAAILAFFPSGSTDISAQIYTRGFQASGYKTYTTIDWGDGTTSIASGTSTDWRSVDYIAPQVHVYNYDDLPAESEAKINGMTCRQALIVLDGSVSGIEQINLSEFNNAQRVSYSNNYQSMPILDVHIECPNLRELYLYTHQYGYPREIERLVINATGEFTTCSSLCHAMTKLRVFEMPHADTSNVTSFAGMFSYCYSLQSVPDLDTSSATNVSSMFNNTRSLKTIPNIDTSNVTNFNSFLLYSYLDEIPRLDYSNGTDLTSCFSAMFKIKTVPSGLDFSSATNINSTFASCYSLQSLPNNIFDQFTNVTTADGTFASCINLKRMPRIDLPNCTNMRRFAQSCHQLEDLHIGDVRSMPTAPYNTNGNFREAFHNLYNAKSIKIDYPDETWASGMYSMFSNCFSLRQAPEINLSKAYWVAYFFGGCHSLEEAPVYDLSNANDYQSFFISCNQLRRVGGFKFGNVKAADASQCFYRCYRLEEFPSGLCQDYYSTPTRGFRMFWETNYLKKMSNVTTSGMTHTNGSPFVTMYGLQEVENVEFSSGDYLPNLFNNCPNLTLVGDWNASGVEDLTGAFSSCRSLRWSDIRNVSCNIGYYDCFLSSGALEHIFTNLASGVVGKTIDVRLNYGTPQLHADTIAIATSKGWTVTT